MIEQNKSAGGRAVANGASALARAKAGAVDGMRLRRWAISGAPRLVEILLVVVLAALLARIVWLIAAPLALPTPGAPIAAAQSAGPAKTQPIVVKNPFGAAEADIVAPVDAAPDVEETTLDLKLAGVWAEGEAGSAIIELPDGDQKRFSVGDEIIDGVRLDAVFRDQVTIRRAGVRESLRFEGKDAARAGATANARPAPPRRTTQPPRATPAAPRARASGGLASVLRVAPGTDENGNRSIEIYASRNRAAFQELGLKDGDRLVSINGDPPPTNPTALSSVLRNLQRRSSVSIVVERGGEEIPISISIDRLRN
ncbi:MAG: type II secretion system protein N [Pseudomonadota bacterium]